MAEEGIRARRRALRTGALVIGVTPLVGLGIAALSDGLGANPIEKITHVTGEWALRLLLATLAVSPLRRLFGWSGLLPFRRTLGLLCFPLFFFQSCQPCP